MSFFLYFFDICHVEVGIKPTYCAAINGGRWGFDSSLKSAPYRYMINCVWTCQPVFNANVPEELYVVKDKKDKKEKKQQNIQDYFQRGGDRQRDNYWDNRHDRSNHYSDNRGYQAIPRFDRGPPPFDGDRYNPNAGNYMIEQNPFKRQKVDIVELKTYHSKLREAVKVLRGQGRLPRVQDMCKLCNTTPDALFEREGICVKDTLFGTCFASCPRQHVAISDEEANKVISVASYNQFSAIPNSYR